MSERGDLATGEIGEQVQTILVAAETAAREITDAAQRRADEQAAVTMVHAQEEAERLRAEATRTLDAYLAAHEREIQAHATARIDRMAELTDRLIEAAQSIQERLEHVGAMQVEVHALIDTIARSAEAVVREAAESPPAIGEAPPLGPRTVDGNGDRV
jgi:hypothetical protein